MRDSSREILGFLCRWALLALVAATVLASVWAATASAAYVRADLGAGLVMPDVIHRPGAKARLIGLAGIGTACGNTPPVLAHRPDGRLDLTRASRCRVYCEPVLVHEGANVVELEGTPFGSLSYRRYRAMIYGVTPGRPVFLLDTRMLSDASGVARADLTDLVRALDERANVGFFHAGPSETFAPLRNRARRVAPGVPVAWFFPAGEQPVGTVHRVARTCSPAGSDPVTVTTDPKTAGISASQGLRTHFIGDRPVATDRPDRLTVHASAAKFKESLPSLPILQ